MTSKLIYLASPYSYVPTQDRNGYAKWMRPFLWLHDILYGAYLLWRRFEQINYVASYIFKHGDFVFSPISHTRPIAKYGLPSGFEFYEKYDKLMISHCTDLWVLCLPGWSLSTGVMEEIKQAKELGKPVTHVYYEDFR